MKHAYRTSVFLTLLAALCALCLLGACSPASQNVGNAATETGGHEEPVAISIRNSTTVGGFAAQVAEKLKDNGYRQTSGYTIDIGNAQQSDYTRSFVWAPAGNERLVAEAKKLSELLGFKFVDDEERFATYAVGFEDRILVMLESQDDRAAEYDKYADRCSGYPPLTAGSSVVFQAEPFDTAAAEAIQKDFDERQSQLRSQAAEFPESEAPSLVVRNANGVDGSAAAAADLLKGQGFDPVVSQRMWPPSDGVWIVYKHRSQEADALRIGEIVGAEKFFCAEEFPGWDYLPEDISVLLGLDWVNASFLEEGQAPYPSYDVVGLRP